MKSNLVSYIFLILSIILIVILFQVNYAVRQFENEIGLKEKKIKLLKESNKVLFTEFSAHINPDYIKKLSSIYLDNNTNNYEHNVIVSEKKFINKVNDNNLMLSTSILNYFTEVEKKDLN
tara:strand:- start:244 stop:603 length:360 start_codon:yes stop_codon:yes gene_type:complete